MNANSMRNLRARRADSHGAPGRSLPKRGPGQQLHRLRRLDNEEPSAARQRASREPWWPTVASRQPVLASGWWCWHSRAA